MVGASGRNSSSISDHVRRHSRSAIALPGHDVDPQPFELALDDRQIAVVLDGDEGLAAAEGK